MADEDSSTRREGDDKPRGKKRKLHTYEKAKLAYEKIQTEKKQKQEARIQREEEREKAVAASKQTKREKLHALSKRTKRGQPKLDLQVELLLKKIERNVSSQASTSGNERKGYDRERSYFLQGAEESGDESASTGQRRRGKRHKYAMLVAYCGRAYFGMQIQKSEDTVEKYLFDALYDLRLIGEKERRKPGEFWYQRAARTDKGVSAVRQVCSLMLPLRDGGKDGGSEEELTSKWMVKAINAILPEDIRVIGLKRTTKTFDAKNACDSRSYLYTLPTYAFSMKDEVSRFLFHSVIMRFKRFPRFRTFPITGYQCLFPDERLSQINNILSSYTGTHNYYNFTCKRSPTDSSCHRYIMRCECGNPFVRDDIEFVTVHLTGQSFMLHQIRKMMGLCIAIVRGYTDKKSIELAWLPERFDVPIAPSLGLVLEEPHYKYYNKKYGQSHQILEWTEYEDEIRSFRERYIDNVIAETEKKESTVLQWLDTLDYHNFDSTKSEESNSTKSDEKQEESGGYVSD